MTLNSWSSLQMPSAGTMNVHHQVQFPDSPASFNPAQQVGGRGLLGGPLQRLQGQGKDNGAQKALAQLNFL